MMNISDIFVGGAGQTVTVLNDQAFDTSGTWVKPALAYLPGDMALVELWGGGGSGAYKGTKAAAMGGSGGTYLRVALPVSSLNATQPVTVGAGGVSSSSTGVAGGNTQFAGLTARGGEGGQQYDASEGPVVAYFLAQKTSLYTPGAGGAVVGTATYPPHASIYGGSGGATSNVTGSKAQSGTAPGGGGGANNASSPTGSYGGDGAPGRVRVRILRGLNQFEISEGPL